MGQIPPPLPRLPEPSLESIIPTLPYRVGFDHTGYSDADLIRHYRTRIRQHSSDPEWLRRKARQEARELVRQAFVLEYERVTLLRPVMPMQPGANSDELLRAI